MNILQKIIWITYYHYFFELSKFFNEKYSVLDVGCGSNSPIKVIKNKTYSVGIDAFEPSLTKSKEKDIHNEYINDKILNLDKHFNEKSFDCVVALDVIEHLTKKDGFELLRKMEKIATKKIVIFTPNGFVEQGDIESNPFQVHISGWSVNEIKDLGFKVYGINGLRYIRGEFGSLRWKPFKFWAIFSLISQIFVRNHPYYAFSLLCVKEI